MLWMSAFGLAVGLEELLDPPRLAHPISSKEKEQPINLKNTDELGDFMETPGALASSVRKPDQNCSCDTAGSFEVAQAAGFDSEEAANGHFHKDGAHLRRSISDALSAAIARVLLEFGSHYPEGTPNVQGMFTGCVGGEGGVAHGPVVVEKSKNSVISGIAASRAVRLGKWKRVSISLSAAV